MPARRTIFLGLALVTAILLTFVFGYRFGRHARSVRWQNEPVHAWMSVPFISHAHHLAPEVLYKAIGAEPRPKDRRPLRRIAREQHRPVEQLIQELNSAIHNPPAGARVP